MPINLHFVPNTGVQYFDLGLIPRGASEKDGFGCWRYAFEQAGSQARFRERPERIVDQVEEDHDEYQEGQYQSVLETPAAMLLAVDALDGIWIPLPMDREGAWVALHLKPVSGSTHFRAHLAVDTTLQQDGNQQGMDVEDTGPRRFSPCGRTFWSQQVVSEYISQLRSQLQEQEKVGRIERIDERKIRCCIVSIAAFMRDCWKGGVVLVPAPRPHRGVVRSVGVNMAIDLGNSRTCVIMNESSGPKQSGKLQLTYPEDPSRRWDCPFETQFVFVEHAVLSPRLEGFSSFRFLSSIQIGPRAGERLRMTQLDPRRLGLSSPKRYLWDQRTPVEWNWSYIDRVGENGEPEPIRSDLLRFMDVADPLRASAMIEPPVQPNYPRLACMVWVIVELLEQAFRQVNSSDWRGAGAAAPEHHRRREIENLVITYPAGLHPQELKNFRKACERACRLWAEFRSNPDRFSRGENVESDGETGVGRPKVHMVCDEGLSIHACWLKSTLRDYENRPTEMLAALGRKRRDGQDHSLRMASLDIGGGTIDVAIAEYSSKPGQNGLHCRRLFNTGISRAGDDLVRCVLENLIFPACIDQVESLNQLSCQLSWNQLFSQAGDGQEGELLRRVSLRSVWRPLAAHLLDAVQFENSEFDFALGEVPGVDQQQLGTLERYLRLSPTALAGVRVRGDFIVLCDQVRRAIGVTLKQCADVIDQFQCDLLVVAGRPSSNPAVRHQLLGHMPVPPGQVTFLADLPVGDGYPFSGHDGRIADAKTCGVAGCMIAFDALRHAGAFSMTLDESAVHVPESEPTVGTVHNVEGVSHFEVRNEDRILADGGLSCSIPPLKGARIAVRRIDDPHAEASPIYHFRLKRNVAGQMNRVGASGSSIGVHLSTSEFDPSAAPEEQTPRATEIPHQRSRQYVQAVSTGNVDIGRGRTLDASEAMQLELNTLMDMDGYWLDTGQFSPIEVPD